jgi:hypothetical protein
MFVLGHYENIAMIEKKVIFIIVNPVNSRITLAMTLHAICHSFEILPKDSVIRNKNNNM